MYLSPFVNTSEAEQMIAVLRLPQFTPNSHPEFSQTNWTGLVARTCHPF